MPARRIPAAFSPRISIIGVPDGENAGLSVAIGAGLA
jgi:hypothetical protein